MGVLIGAGGLIVAAFLPWVKDSETTAFDIPLKFLVDPESSDGFEFGIPMIVVAVLCVLVSAASAPGARRALSLVALFFPAAFVYQLWSEADAFGGDVSDYLGNGALVAFVAGIVLLVSNWKTREQ